MYFYSLLVYLIYFNGDILIIRVEGNNEWRLVFVFTVGLLY